MPRLIGRLLSILFVASVAAGSAVSDPAFPAVPLIDVEQQGDSVLVSGYVRGLKSRNVSATMEIAKSDGSGVVRTSQGRELTLSPGSNDLVATTRLSSNTDTNLVVTLTLTSDGVQVATTSMAIGSDSN